jgi:hypothetical protein
MNYALTLRGKKWHADIQAGRLARDARRGDCDLAKRQIRVQCGELQELETLLHEVLHALHPRWGHRKVYRDSEALAGVLQACGYRRGKR